MGLKTAIARNLRQPKGLFGKIIGLLMNKGNDYMNRYTLQLLNPQVDDHILEIGFGNGKYIAETAKITLNGFVAGVDYSETMVNQARKRNKALIDQGIVDIRLGEVDRIAFEEHTFDKVFTVNTIYFWPNPTMDIKEIYRVLKPNGKLIISFRSKEQMEKLEITKNGFRLFEPKEVIQLAKDAGFRDVNLESSEDKHMDVNCVIAVK
jgi:SAM-dependent methyltransferase